MGTLGWMLAGESQSFLLSFSIVVHEAAILSAVVLAGFAIRNRRLMAIETRERVRLARVEQDARAAAERMRIARELHDVVAHTVAVILARTAANPGLQAPLSDVQNSGFAGTRLQPPARRTPTRIPSLRACQEASMMFWWTPTVPQLDSPFVVSIRTRTRAAVPSEESRSRTL